MENMENNLDGDENVGDLAVVEEAKDSKETPWDCKRRMDSRCKTLCICIAFVMSILFALVFGIVIGLVILPEKPSRTLRAELQRLANDAKQLQMKNNQLMQLANSTRQNIILAERENDNLNVLLNATQQTAMQLKTENQRQRSILSDDKVSFLWQYCNKSTLQCSRCPSGWVEHASRCFYISQKKEVWQSARSSCLLLKAHLVVVLNKDDQEFLTNMTFNFVQQNPMKNVNTSVWIGLNDLVREGKYFWINTEREKSGDYLTHDRPTNTTDCVAIVPPTNTGQNDWLKNWDDLACDSKQHYLCEAKVLELS